MSAHDAKKMIELVDRAIDKADVGFSFGGFCDLEEKIGLPRNWLVKLYLDSLAAQRIGEDVIKHNALVTILRNYVEQ